MEFEENLTNEKMSKKFNSQFDMVNYLIEYAREMIHSGRAVDAVEGSDNIAVNTVAEVAMGKDQMRINETTDLSVEEYVHGYEEVELQVVNNESSVS